MAGRNISVTHEALGAVRVMRTGGCMGEVVGLAAALCKRFGVEPRGIYEKHLADLKASLARGVTPNPAFVRQPLQSHTGTGAASRALAPMPKNVARKAKVTADGSAKGAEKLTDGKIDLNDNAGRWLSAKGERHEILLAWPTAVTLKGVRVVSGYTSGKRTIGTAGGVAVEGRTPAGEWRRLGQCIDRSVDQRVGFAPAEVTDLRIILIDTKGGIARVWEVEAW
jgi:hypothetical protein